MSEIKVNKLMAFVPAKDYELSISFYQDMGFKIVFQTPQVVSPPAMQPWNLIEILLFDPSGVFWHIAQKP